MIFVTLGSQKFQFNRLLKAIDKLIEENKILDDVFAQIGYSDYIPVNFEFKDFLDREKFKYFEEKADIVITHGGTGAIIGAVKKRKKVIAVPRLSKYGEHVDDHQIQIIDEFEKQNLIYGIKDCAQLENAIKYVKVHHFDTYISNTANIIDSIDSFIVKQVID